MKNEDLMEKLNQLLSQPKENKVVQSEANLFKELSDLMSESRIRFLVQFDLEYFKKGI